VTHFSAPAFFRLRYSYLLLDNLEIGFLLPAWENRKVLMYPLVPIPVTRAGFNNLCHLLTVHQAATNTTSTSDLGQLLQARSSVKHRSDVQLTLSASTGHWLL
jgi:hypothetical protein